MTDSVAQSWWTTPAPLPVMATSDAELYRYGVHGKEFCANVTVGPGTYYVRLKFAANRRLDTCQNCVSIAINGQRMVSQMDVAATAGGTMRAVDLVFNDIQPRNGVIDIRFVGGNASMSLPGEAFVQAIEVGQGSCNEGAVPVTVLGRNLLRNAGFEQWTADERGMTVAEKWQCEVEAKSAMVLESVISPLDDGEQFGAVAEGTRAARLRGSGRSRLMQEVAVCPGSAYRASALVSAHGAAAAGTGAQPAGAAALLLEELSAAGQVLKQHRTPAALEADAYRYVSLQLTTLPDTARVRFVLDTMLRGDAASGWISYDHCVVDGPPAPARIVGLVTDNARQPLPGALVSAGTRDRPNRSRRDVLS